MSLRDEGKQGAKGHGFAAPFGLVVGLQCRRAFSLVRFKSGRISRHVLDGERDAAFRLALDVAQRKSRKCPVANTSGMCSSIMYLTQSLAHSSVTLTVTL